jgi:hypothetical protein
MNAETTYEVNSRVTVNGRRGKVAQIDRSPFGGFLIHFDDGTTAMHQMQELTVPPITDEPLAETAPKIDPGLSAADNFTRAFPA